MHRRQALIAGLMAAVLLTPAFAQPADLVRNGGFEQGLQNWVCWHKELLDQKRVNLSLAGRGGGACIEFVGDPDHPLNGALNLSQADLPLRPSTDYEITFYVKGEGGRRNARRRLQLALREFGKRGRTRKMHYIAFAPAEGQWRRYRRAVKTLDAETKRYQLIFYVRNLKKGEKVRIDDVRIRERDPAKDRRELEAFLKELKRRAARRRPVTDRTYVFARSQIKYGMGRNYLHWWLDRPLFQDRSARGPHGTPYQVTEASFLRDIDIVRRLYRMDGLAGMCVNLGQTTNYERAATCAERAGFRDFIVYPEFAGVGKVRQPIYGFYTAALARALKSPRAFRVKGKPVVTSYVADSWTPARMKAVLDALRKEHGDRFLFVADIRRNLSMIDFQDRRVTVEDIEAEMERIRSYLDVCDGIMFAGANHTKLYFADNRYGNSMNCDYLENYLAPVFGAVLAEEKYRGKLLGLSSAVAYINHRGSSCKRDDRTRSLRRTFEIAMAARPDFIQQPEWNEFNENTCFQPTLRRGLSTGRIIRYYMSRIRREKPTPNPGDDLDVPNLIVSYRQVLRIGEELFLELLNVPDSDSAATYTARLTLLDLDGKTVKAFPAETFTVNRLREKTYALATEDLAAHRVLIPVVEVVNPKGKRIRFIEGLKHIDLDPSWNWNYLAVKQPLRDVPRDVQCAVLCESEEGRGRRSARLRVDVRAPEPIATAELLERETEVGGFDPSDEFGLDRNMLVRVSFHSYGPFRWRGRIGVKNASAFYCRSAENDNLGTTDPGDPDAVWKVGPRGVTVNARCLHAPHFIYLTIPEKDVSKAVIEIDNDRGGLTIPAAKLRRLGVYAKVFPGQYVLRVEDFKLLPDTPPHANRRRVTFTKTLEPRTPFPVYYVRVVTKTGRIFRSRPMAPFRPEGKPEVTLNVFSGTTNKVAPVRLHRSVLTDLDYRFEPSHGDLMLTDAGPRWTAELGGGVLYGEPFNRKTGYGRPVKRPSPRWVTVDGAQALEFDGVGNYVNLPHESLPRGAFTLTMEVKPTSPANMILLRNRGNSMGALLVKIRGGRLWALYRDRRFNVHPFDTKLPVPDNVWTRIDVVYDMRRIKFTLNRKASKAFPLTAFPYAYQPCIIGGHNKPGYGVTPGDRFFKGYLRRLRIAHWAE